VDFSYHIWNNVPDNAKELIKGLLAKDAADRMNLQDVLQHPWITGNEKSILARRRKSGDGNAADQFKAFAVTEDFLKAAKSEDPSSD